MTIEEKVRRFILEELRPDRRSDELTDDLPLIERDVIDSLGIFQLVGFLEEEFGVEIVDEELVFENFETIGSIAGFIGSKQAVSQI